MKSLDAIAWLINATIAALFLFQTWQNAAHPTDTGHAHFIGLREGEQP